MSFIFAPAIHKDTTHYLQSIIEDHLELFCQLFPEERVKPKQHYLLHYPRCIRKVGPLLKFWCMRFEAKHNFFRRLSHIVSNFKNICKTMAYRHQLFMCYKFYAKCHVQKSLEVGNGYVTSPAVDEFGTSLQEALTSLGMYEEVFRARWVKLNGIQYKPTMSVVVRVDDVGLPQFGYILAIYVRKGSVHFCVEVWETLYFERHLFSYCVQQHTPYCVKVLDTSHLLDPHPVIINDGPGNRYFVALRYKPCSV